MEISTLSSRQMAIIIRMYTARLLTTLDQRLCEKVFTAFNEYFMCILAVKPPPIDPVLGPSFILNEEKITLFVDLILKVCSDFYECFIDINFPF